MLIIYNDIDLYLEKINFWADHIAMNKSQAKNCSNK